MATRGNRHIFLTESDSVTDDDLFDNPVQSQAVIFRRMGYKTTEILGSPGTVVDMVVDTQMEELMKNGNISTVSSQERKVASFIWEIDESVPAGITLLHFQMKGVDELWYSNFYRAITQDNFRHCRQFVVDCFRQFGVKVARFEPVTLTFVAIHDSPLRRTIFDDRDVKQKVIQVFKDMAIRCVSRPQDIDVEAETIHETFPWKELMEENALPELKVPSEPIGIADGMESGCIPGNGEVGSLDSMMMSLWDRQTQTNAGLDSIMDMLSKPREDILMSYDGKALHPNLITPETPELSQSLMPGVTSLETTPKTLVVPGPMPELPSLGATCEDPAIRTRASGISPDLVRSMMTVSQDFSMPDDISVNRLHEAVVRNLPDAVPPPPRADTHDTILCLDASKSMEGEGFVAMKRIAHSIVDGFEGIAEKYNIEENIAVVSISDFANIQQQLTNDYSMVRDAIDNLTPSGRTPFFEAILVCQTALNGKGRISNVQGVHKVRPRILFVTDGHPTDESKLNGLDHESPSHVTHKLSVLRLVTDMATSEVHSSSDPIVWIPIGKAGKQFLGSLAKAGKGILASEDDVPKLCQYFRIEQGIGMVYSCVSKDKSPEASLVNIISVLVPDLSKEEKIYVEGAVKEKLRNQPIDKDPDDFDDIHEDLSSFPPLGSRVTRGPDWKWGDQDSGGPGTVISHNSANKGIWVRWDSGSQNRYSYGADRKYDVLLTDDSPMIPDGNIAIGVTVARGPHWHHGDEDGGLGAKGVVIRKRGTRVKVRWGDGSIKEYAYHLSGSQELTICDPFALGIEKSMATANLETPALVESTGTLPRDEEVVWQWQDERQQWRLYPDDIQWKLNQEARKEKARSCLVSRNGMSFRVFINKSIERAIEGDNFHHVRKLAMSIEELQCARVAERFADS